VSTLDDTTALVTGASRGIGRGIAKTLADSGAAVGVNHPPTDRERDAAQSVIADIEATDGEGQAIEGDVSDPDSVTAMVSEFEDHFGPPDILVNNAGIISESPLAEMSVEQWDELMKVNLRGVFLVTRAALPRMINNDDGTIINVASQLGFVGASNLVHYSASKGGIIAFTRALAKELAPDITVNAIAPGAINTDLGDNLKRAERPKSEIPLGRYGTIEEVALTAKFLASEGGAYYTGQTLSPDGGDAMH